MSMSKSEYEPDILVYEEDGYFADSYKVEWESEELVLYEGPFVLCKINVIESPHEELWKQFWKVMQNIKIWDWYVLGKS